MHEKSLLALLRENQAEGRLPFHMPGHKRNDARFAHLAPLGGAMDITEIDGFDNLHDAEGILREAMERAAALWHSDRAFFLINGSSCGILAGIRAMTRRGDTVLLSRNAHKSVFHAIELCGLRPIFLMPPIDPTCGMVLSMPPETVEEALRAHPETRLVILTSPSYEGVLSDVQAIADAAHAHGATLLVDEAHGAHLSLHPYFPVGAVSLGADIVVQSVHKTLPSLTQTAVLHACGARVDLDRLAHQLSVFETSSPSYLLLSSIDGCVRALSEDAGILDDWAERLQRFDAQLGSLTRLHVPFHGTNPAPLAGVFAYDPSKLFVSCAQSDISGPSLAAFLRTQNIEPEMVVPQGVLLMSGAGDTPEMMDALATALRTADERCQAALGRVSMTLPPIPAVCEIEPEQALERPWEFIRPECAIGRICAEYVWAYPPGIPLLIPGERIGVENLPGAACETHSTHGKMPEKIAVLL